MAAISCKEFFTFAQEGKSMLSAAASMNKYILVWTKKHAKL
jgi:hypothetical protein